MRKIYTMMLAAIFFFAANTSSAEIHIITQQDISFNPASLEVNVGDVVRWVWTSGSHTTTSVSVPGGAASWNSPLHAGSTQFDYTVTVAGVYAYVCTPHASMGMMGTFTAVEEAPSCAISPEMTQDGNTVTVSINGSGATMPQYLINWGDGSTPSGLSSDSHTYSAPGTYEICVGYSDQNNPNGCTVTSCDFSVVIEEPEPVECSVEFTVDVEGNTVWVSAEGTGVENGQYSIDWGDGEENDMTPEASHTYEEDGEYTICVTYGIFTKGGCISEECSTVTVGEEQPVECSLEISVIGMGGLTVLLTSTGTGAENPNYSVDWGDDTALGTDAAATHEYAEEGEYTICVTYSDLDNIENCIIEQCTTIVVSASTAECSVTLTLSNVGNTYTATAVGTGAEVPQYLINWGDSSAPTIGNSGNHTYTEPGEYEVCALYTDFMNMTNCAVIDCHNIEITVGIEESKPLLSQLIAIPNPVGESAQILFSLSKAAQVQIDLLDVLGKRIETITTGMRGQGIHRVDWNSHSLSAGVYFVRIIAEGEQHSIRIMK